jgi:hypothetical protein
LAHNAVPFARLQVVHAILPIRDQFNAVLEPHHGGDLSQQVDAKALVPGVAAQVTLGPMHYVGSLLQTAVIYSAKRERGWHNSTKQSTLPTKEKSSCIDDNKGNRGIRTKLRKQTKNDTGQGRKGTKK